MIEAKLKKLVDEEAARMAARRDKDVQVSIEPVRVDMCIQTNFMPPPATLRQHNATTCHPSYFDSKTSVVMGRPAAYPLPSELAELSHAGVQASLPQGTRHEVEPFFISTHQHDPCDW